MKVKPVELDLSTFQPKHLQLLKWASSPNIRNILAAGGVRSGKTVTIMTILFMRAMLAPGSTHGIFHAQRNICKRNLFETTFPETLDYIAPGWFSSLKNSRAEHYIDNSDLEIRLPGGSKLLFMGCDDPEKFRGLKLSSAFVNEANFVDYKTIMVLKGRLSESIPMVGGGGPLVTKMFYDLNPTVKSSWEYQLFVEGVVPGERKPIENHKKSYRYLTINAIDNKPNLPDSLFEDFAEMTEEQRRRDEHGMWSEDNPNALFNVNNIQRKWINHVDLAEIVVAVDPAGTSGNASDHTGIIVVGRATNGDLYVLEDATMKDKPEKWIERAIQLRKKYDANWIITEETYGKDILKDLMMRVAVGEPLKFVDARGRGKRLRAEPVSAMYDQGRISHIKIFSALEMQMAEFDSPTFKGSPDRVDALVYALLHLSGNSAVGPARTTFASGFFS